MLAIHVFICLVSPESGTSISYLCLMLASVMKSDLCSMSHHVKGSFAWKMTFADMLGAAKRHGVRLL